MYEMHINELSKRSKRKKEQIVSLLNEAIKCKTLFSCFTYEHIETRIIFQKYKILLVIKLLLRWLIYPAGDIIKVRTKYRLMQYFAWKQIDFGENINNKLFITFKRKFFQLIELYLHLHLVKTVQYYISPFAIIDKGFWSTGPIDIAICAWSKIGKNVNLGVGVVLTGGGSKQSPLKKTGYAIEVKEGAVIWTGAILTNGVIIGRNSIVGANSLVINDVPDGATVLGNPAKIVFVNPFVNKDINSSMSK
ncbi:MAG: hypothetical protein HQK91_03085 [Nitrospirae bacterium]|nr:hypothetical protein [Nitrospirota bacterium]MBF0540421.1 hypothetical protein [Nitrospirota bacterium]